MAGHIATSKRSDWCTDEDVLDIARTTFGGQIGLDPCSNSESIVNARKEFRLGRPVPGQYAPGLTIGDGLLLPWGREQTFVNPPFGTIYVHRETMAVVDAADWKQVPEAERAAYDKKTIGMWTAKVRTEHDLYAAEVTLLVPASVDTGPWHRDIWSTASAVGFFKGRLKFRGADACAPMACALAYFGHRPQRFEAAFQPAGKVVRP
jgi:hypothetical protein